MFFLLTTPLFPLGQIRAANNQADRSCQSTHIVCQERIDVYVTETDDPILYGTNCSPGPLPFPDPTRDGKCEGFPAPRAFRAAFSLLGSILLSLSCNTVQMF